MYYAKRSENMFTYESKRNIIKHYKYITFIEFNITFCVHITVFL